MKSEFEVAFNEIAEMRSLSREMVLEALRNALVSAYKRDASVGASQRVEATIDENSGRPRILVEKEVVEEVFDHRTEVDLERARFYHPEANLGDTVMVQVEGSTKRFGRIAAQTAKQVILQKIREAERNALYEEFSTKEGDIMTGVVQSVNPSMVTITLNNKAEAILPRAQQIPSERYKPHDKIRVYVVEVKRSNRGPQIIVSRSHRDMLRRLLEYEVPEIFNHQVEIKSIAREAGYRSKVAVAALQDGIDPVGACVGMRGIRIQNIVKELHEEKIDVIEWSPNQEEYIKKALSPARVQGVYLEDDPESGRTAVVIVPDDQLSLAIGREGQNARLAAKLTGWRIDIKSVAEAVQEAVENLHTPALKPLAVEHGDMFTEARRILEKRVAQRAVMPEEYSLLGRLADVIQRRLMSIREQARQQRLAEINAVRQTLPPAAFQMPVDALELPEALIEALRPMQNVGEIMLRFLIDERRLRHLLHDQPGSALQVVQEALDKIVLPEYIEPKAEPEPEAEPQPEAEPVLVVEPAAVGMAVAAADEDEEVVPYGFADEPESQPAARKPQPQPQLQTAQPGAAPAFVDPAGFGSDDEEDELDASGKSKGKGTGNKKKERSQRRQIVYDEDLGEMVVKRRRKGARGGKWDEWEE